MSIENLTNDQYYEALRQHEEPNEPIGSCDNCGVNMYRDEDDGSGLCDQCQWWAALRIDE